MIRFLRSLFPQTKIEARSCLQFYQIMTYCSQFKELFQQNTQSESIRMVKTTINEEDHKRMIK